MKPKPLADRVIVGPIEQQEQKKGGIIIPDTAKETPMQGDIVAVGPGKQSDDGKKIPLRQTAFNVGIESSVVTNRVASKNGAFGFNALNNQYEDLIKAGVIGPTKVARTALENAASVAVLVLTTEAVVCDKPERKNSPGRQGMPPDMDVMY